MRRWLGRGSRANWSGTTWYDGMNDAVLLLSLSQLTLCRYRYCMIPCNGFKLPLSHVEGLLSRRRLIALERSFCATSTPFEFSRR